MRSVLEDEEELAPQPQPADREFTLSSTTLLAIFFGLVLVCGLFFALGYTLGRRAGSDTAQQANTQPGGATPVSSLAFASQSKPSAGAASPAAVAPAAPADTDQTASADPPADASNPPAADSPGNPNPTPAGGWTVAPTPAAAVPATPQQPGTGITVQIAAVSNPADADVLMSALRRRGYSVSIVHEPGDQLMHVQVGPFSNRADALAMRQKLLSDGYNAILK